MTGWCFQNAKRHDVCFVHRQLLVSIEATRHDTNNYSAGEAKLRDCKRHAFCQPPPWLSYVGQLVPHPWRLATAAPPPGDHLMQDERRWIAPRQRSDATRRSMCLPENIPRLKHGGGHESGHPRAKGRRRATPSDRGADFPERGQGRGQRTKVRVRGRVVAGWAIATGLFQR